MDTFCRIMTRDFSDNSENQVKSFVTDKLASIGIHEITFTQMRAYWKSADQGEISCQFLSEQPLEQIQSLFADTWRSDCADARWSRIHCPHATFMWISR